MIKTRLQDNGIMIAVALNIAMWLPGIASVLTHGTLSAAFFVTMCVFGAAAIVCTLIWFNAVCRELREDTLPRR